MSIFPRTPACALALVFASTYGCSAAEEHVKESRDAGAAAWPATTSAPGARRRTIRRRTISPQRSFAADAYFIPSG